MNNGWKQELFAFCCRHCRVSKASTCRPAPHSDLCRPSRTWHSQPDVGHLIGSCCVYLTCMAQIFRSHIEQCRTTIVAAWKQEATTQKLFCWIFLHFNLIFSEIYFLLYTHCAVGQAACPWPPCPIKKPAVKLMSGDIDPTSYLYSLVVPVGCLNLCALICPGSRLKAHVQTISLFFFFLFFYRSLITHTSINMFCVFVPRRASRAHVNMLMLFTQQRCELSLAP